MKGIMYGMEVAWVAVFVIDELEKIQLNLGKYIFGMYEGGNKRGCTLGAKMVAYSGQSRITAEEVQEEDGNDGG